MTRWHEGVKGADFQGVDEEIICEAFELHHGMSNSIEGSHSWYENSCKSREIYEECDGDDWNWGGNGYATILDLLQVFFGRNSLKKPQN